MNFQVISDLHLEFLHNIPSIVPSSDNLILAGDIGIINTNSFQLFLEYVNQNWKKVFYVLGNHEYYKPGIVFEKLKEKYKSLFKKYENIILLDRKSIVINDNTILLGATFWPSVTKPVESFINDFQQIKIYEEETKRYKKMDVSFMNKLHNEEKTWLINTLEKYKEIKNIIIVSHFPLTQIKTSDPKFSKQQQYIKDYFANEFDYIFERMPNNFLIVSGHTHYSYDFTKNNRRYLSNQKGYLSDKTETFQEEKSFSI